MKNRKILLLAACLCLLMAMFLTACDEPNAPAGTTETTDLTGTTESPAEGTTGGSPEETGPAHTHTEEIIPGKAATCTEDGLTDGKRCTTCQTVTVAQEVIKAGHTFADTLTSDADYHWYPATCGHTEETKDKGAHNFVDGACTACGRKQASTTVTAAEWKALFESSNFTMHLKNGLTTQILKFDGTNLECYMEYDGEGLTMLWELSADEQGNPIWWEYGEYAFEGDWVKELDEYGNGGRMYEARALYFCPLGDLYGQFTYDAASKTYVASRVAYELDGEDYALINVCVKIENGTLAEVFYTVENPISGAEIEITEVGSTTVLIPITTYTATETEWKGLLTGDHVNNVRVFVECMVDGLPSDGYRLAFTDTAIQYDWDHYFVKKDGVWYEVTHDYNSGKGEFIGVARAEDEVGTFQNAIGAKYADRYADFTYDAENHCYVATNFKTADSETEMEVKLYIRNGKLVGMEEKAVVEENGQSATVETVYEIFNYGWVDAEDLEVPEFTVQ